MKGHRHLIKNILVVIIMLLVTAQLPAKDIQNKPLQIINDSSSRHKLRYVIINNGPHNYGYDIIDHNRVFIHQPSIPSVQGNKGFATKEDAAKVAKLVIKKINKNIMPPAVTQQELKSLKINP